MLTITDYKNWALNDQRSAVALNDGGKARNWYAKGSDKDERGSHAFQPVQSGLGSQSGAARRP